MTVYDEQQNKKIIIIIWECDGAVASFIIRGNQVTNEVQNKIGPQQKKTIIVVSDQV